MKIIATSDFHGYLPDIPACDILLIAGDVCPVWNHERKFQSRWLRGRFSEWLEAQPATVIVGVGGNHDFVLDGSDLGYELPWTYLNNETHLAVMADEGKEFKIWGSPLSCRFGGWAFMRPDPVLGAVWETIPRDIDILMTHGPAFSLGDRTLSGEDVGSKTLTRQLVRDQWPNLKLHVFGHIHEAYGTLKYAANDATGANVSHVNLDYDPVNQPMEFDL